MRTMRIIDGTQRLVRAPTVTFEADEIDEEAFGYNIVNRALNAALQHAIEQTGPSAWSIPWRVPPLSVRRSEDRSGQWRNAADEADRRRRRREFADPRGGRNRHAHLELSADGYRSDL
jgi:hypothetical protein